jgi:hypothetical protein
MSSGTFVHISSTFPTGSLVLGVLALALVIPSAHTMAVPASFEPSIAVKSLVLGGLSYALQFVLLLGTLSTLLRLFLLAQHNWLMAVVMDIVPRFKRRQPQQAPTGNRTDVGTAGEEVVPVDEEAVTAREGGGTASVEDNTANRRVDHAEQILVAADK